ncbi:cupin domain-containing protein [Actinomadura luteofluorescens]
MFYVLSGTARFLCDGEELVAGPGSFVLLPVGLPHTFVVGSEEPLRCLQITTPSGFEEFAADAGSPASELRLPDPGPFDPAALGHVAARHHVEILGPPPNTT